MQLLLEQWKRYLHETVYRLDGRRTPSNETTWDYRENTYKNTRLIGASVFEAEPWGALVLKYDLDEPELLFQTDYESYDKAVSAIKTTLQQHKLPMPNFEEFDVVQPRQPLQPEPEPQLPDYPSETAIKEYFGITFNPREAGYILSDGTMLDFSGRHYAGGYKYDKQYGQFRPKQGKPDYYANDRVIDHREIGPIFGVGGTDGMIQFQVYYHVIRYQFPNIVDITGFIPSNQQVAALREIVEDDILIVDIYDEKGSRLATHDISAEHLQQVASKYL